VWGLVQEQLSLGFSVLPLVGGSDPARGKTPALASWQVYQQRRPTLAEAQTWFADGGRTAYGIICGPVSQLAVLDIDRADVAEHLARQVPRRLLQTRVVRSGLRGTPHYYWRVDFAVASQRVIGGELKGAGGYVVGAGSQIAGGMWEVVDDLPIRAITRRELAAVLACIGLATPPPNEERRRTYSLPVQSGEAQPSPASPPLAPSAPPQPRWTAGTVAALYQAQVRASGQRNAALFWTACQARDAGYEQGWAVEALAEVHAQTEPRQGQRQEAYARRYREATRTIASAYSRPARRAPQTEGDGEPVSRLDNHAREAILQRKTGDGTAILRVVEGLALTGLAAGEVFTLEEAGERLAGTVGRHSLRVALAARNAAGEYLFQRMGKPSVRSCPPDKTQFLSDSEATSVSASAGVGGLAGGANPHRPAQRYLMPDAAAVCAWAGVKPGGGDPLRLADLRGASAYRQALEREFIKRRPGQYSQALLAGRLGVSSRTLRRYHAVIPIRSRACYHELPLDGSNVQLVPPGSELAELNLSGGRFLLDETGQRWPAKREIAERLLRRGRRVEYRIQTTSCYWYGEREPVLPAQMAGYRPVSRDPRRRAAFEQATATVVTEGMRAAPESVGFVQFAQSRPEGTADIIYVKTLVYNPPRPPETQPVESVQPKRASRRAYRRPLADPTQEHTAQWAARWIENLSEANARRLVTTYGVEAVTAALKRTHWLMGEGRVHNPAGFLITASRLAWRARHPGQLAPQFKAEPKRAPRRQPDSPSAPLPNGGSA
jgi:hypothetical protein